MIVRIAGDGQQTASGNHNTVDTEVVYNGAIAGMFGDGVAAEMFAGGGTVESLDNHTTTKVNQNGAIVGETKNGIHLFGESAAESEAPAANEWVCCAPADTNTIDISNNTGGILGESGDGINFNRICCSVNLVTITGNQGSITGQSFSGIAYVVDGSWGACPYVDVNGNGFPDALEHSVNALTISGNDISGSAREGIYIASGAFDAGMVSICGVPKSAITNNTINGNGENGVYLDTVEGINIGPGNTISGNGSRQTRTSTLACRL